MNASVMLERIREVNDRHRSAFFKLDEVCGMASEDLRVQLSSPSVSWIDMRDRARVLRSVLLAQVAVLDAVITHADTTESEADRCLG